MLEQLNLFDDNHKDNHKEDLCGNPYGFMPRVGEICYLPYADPDGSTGYSQCLITSIHGCYVEYIDLERGLFDQFISIKDYQEDVITALRSEEDIQRWEEYWGMAYPIQEIMTWKPNRRRKGGGT